MAIVAIVEKNAGTVVPRTERKRWEKPVVEDDFLESEEDVLGGCFSMSSGPISDSPCGPGGSCFTE